MIGTGRVTKFAQRISEALNLGRREMAILCTLLLRGPQTLGEIKDRGERMLEFADLEETARVLDKMSEWPDGAIAKKPPKQPGQQRSPRWTIRSRASPEIKSPARSPGFSWAKRPCSPAARSSGFKD